MKLEFLKRENFSQFLLKFSFLNRGYLFRFQSYNLPKAWVYGISSRTRKGKYVLFHDYDDLSLPDVLEDLKFLQERFKLSNYYVFQIPDKSNSFHAICLDTFTISEAFEIQKSSCCDLAFINSIKFLKSKEWILRVGKKGNRAEPEFVKILESKFNKRVKSTAHKDYLRKIGISKEYFKGKFDGVKFLGVVKYNTANRVD